MGGNTLSLVCLQEQEGLRSSEGHRELAKMGTSRNSHSEIQSLTSTVFEDQIHVQNLPGRFNVRWLCLLETVLWGGRLSGRHVWAFDSCFGATHAHACAVDVGFVSCKEGCAAAPHAAPFCPSDVGNVWQRYSPSQAGSSVRVL